MCGSISDYIMCRFVFLFLLVTFSLLQCNLALNSKSTTESAFINRIRNTVYLDTVGLVLHREVQCMSTGAHLIVIQSNYTLEKQHQAIAVTVYDMWTKLHIMEDVNKILVNASLNATSHILDATPGAFMGTVLNSTNKEDILNYLFDILEVEFKANPTLYQIYSEKKQKIMEQNLPPLKSGTISLNSLKLLEQKMDEMLISNPKLHNIVVNERFLQYAYANNLSKAYANNDTNFENQLMVRSILKLSSPAASLKPEETSTVQNMYDLAVKSTAENMDVHKVRVSEFDNMVILNETAIDNMLFSSLKQSFQKDPPLNALLATVKDSLLKEIRS